MTVGARVPDPKKEQQAKVTGCRVALVRAQSRCACASGSSAAREGRIPFTSWRGPQHTLQKKPKVFGFLNTKVLFTGFGVNQTREENGQSRCGMLDYLCAPRVFMCTSSIHSAFRISTDDFHVLFDSHRTLFEQNLGIQKSEDLRLFQSAGGALHDDYPLCIPHLPFSSLV